MIKVLYICLGNICRSPLAEAIMRQLVEEEGLSDKFEIDSCGTAAYHIGETPDERTLANARKNGIEINHRGRQFSTLDFEQFDYLLTMDDANFRKVKALQNGKGDYKLGKLRDFDEEGIGQDVPDPYYGGPEGFQHVFDLLMRSNKALLQSLKEAHQLV
ncbi:MULTISPECIES: low molecular weight protein-tyrosine-phosphatase [Persicobacter]|uniref:protein-tyrosine-phosphatase n=1 Tax=Persicobacter diffluens TaxID=981 RepID=A0AAN4VXJ4_9BACT|nr:low molecular weight protein-tyrosine-phosphatase [Persicobacter sp. CCB-QB2]GJM61904.1 phosphotyrosine protein phosphatase [Persicobacter diffluens]